MNNHTTDIYTNPTGMAEMRRQAKESPGKALPEAARQAEAMFVKILLQTMRATKLGPDIGGDSDQSRFYQDMLDGQFATQLTKGDSLGIGKIITRQLGDEPAMTEANDGGFRRVQSPAYRMTDPAAIKSPAITHKAPPTSDRIPRDAEDFLQIIWPEARRVGQELGVDPHAIVAHTVLETGWGRHQMTYGNDHRPTYNFFGIKATPGWQGEKVANATLEYRDGIAVRCREVFRAYGSVAEAFDDYARLLRNNPRYTEAVKVGKNPSAFADALQAAGYATDPNYASKFKSILRGEQISTLKINAGPSLTIPVAPT